MRFAWQIADGMMALLKPTLSLTATSCGSKKAIKNVLKNET